MALDETEVQQEARHLFRQFEERLPDSQDTIDGYRRNAGITKAAQRVSSRFEALTSMFGRLVGKEPKERIISKIQFAALAVRLQPHEDNVEPLQLFGENFEPVWHQETHERNMENATIADRVSAVFNNKVEAPLSDVREALLDSKRIIECAHRMKKDHLNEIVKREQAHTAEHLETFLHHSRR